MPATGRPSPSRFRRVRPHLTPTTIPLAGWSSATCPRASSAARTLPPQPPRLGGPAHRGNCSRPGGRSLSSRRIQENGIVASAGEDGAKTANNVDEQGISVKKNRSQLAPPFSAPSGSLSQIAGCRQKLTVSTVPLSNGLSSICNDFRARRAIAARGGWGSPGQRGGTSDFEPSLTKL